jgi:hypothetical protein
MLTEAEARRIASNICHCLNFSNVEVASKVESPARNRMEDLGNCEPL